MGWSWKLHWGYNLINEVKWWLHKFDPVTSSENCLVWKVHTSHMTKWWSHIFFKYYQWYKLNKCKKKGLKYTFDRECFLWDFSSGRRTTIFLSYFRSLFLLYISSLTNDDLVLYRGPYLLQTNKGSRKKLFLNTAHCFILLSKMKRKCYYKEIKLLEPWFIENYL